MKKYLKLLICTYIALNASSARALIYRIDFTYGSDLSSENAGLSGFIRIDTSLDTSNNMTTDNPGGYSSAGALPSWITEASLTYDPTPLNPGSGDEVVRTRNTFRLVKWDLKTDGSFDVTSDFVPQMDGFGLVSTDSDNSYTIGNSTFKQNYVGVNPSTGNSSESEFLLQSTATTPGELPILGFGALIYYFRKLKNNKLKL